MKDFKTVSAAMCKLKCASHDAVVVVIVAAVLAAAAAASHQPRAAVELINLG